MHKLGSPNNHSIARSITVNQNGVHVLYYESSPSNVTKHWHDGTVYEMEDNSGSAEAVFALKDDVYVVGSEKNPGLKRQAKLWKNGEGVNITNGNGQAIAKDVFVVKR